MGEIEVEIQTDTPDPQTLESCKPNLQPATQAGYDSSVPKTLTTHA